MTLYDAYPELNDFADLLRAARAGGGVGKKPAAGAWLSRPKAAAFAAAGEGRPEPAVGCIPGGV